MDYKNLKDAIKAVIKKNGAQEITGQIMQDTLLSIVSKLGSNKTFAGVARPTTVPDTTDANIFYIAGENGTYVNFGGAKVENEAAVFVQVSGGTWRAIYTGIQTSYGVNNQLRQEHEYFETGIDKVSADLTQFKQTEFNDVKEDVAGNATEIAKNKSAITKINGEIATLNEATNTAADELVRIEGKVDANLKDAVVVFGPSTNTGIYKGADILSFTNDTPTSTVTAYMSQYWDKLVKLASGKISGSVYAESNNANCTGGSCIGGTQFGYLKIEIEDYQKGGLAGEALVLSYETDEEYTRMKINKDRGNSFLVERIDAKNILKTASSLFNLGNAIDYGFFYNKTYNEFSKDNAFYSRIINLENLDTIRIVFNVFGACTVCLMDGNFRMVHEFTYTSHEDQEEIFKTSDYATAKYLIYSTRRIKIATSRLQIIESKASIINDCGFFTTSLFDLSFSHFVDNKKYDTDLSTIGEDNSNASYFDCTKIERISVLTQPEESTYNIIVVNKDSTHINLDLSTYGIYGSSYMLIDLTKYKNRKYVIYNNDKRYAKVPSMYVVPSKNVYELISELSSSIRPTQALLYVYGDGINKTVSGEDISPNDEYSPSNEMQTLENKPRYKNFAYYIAKRNKLQWYDFAFEKATLTGCKTKAAPDLNCILTDDAIISMTDQKPDYITLWYGVNDAQFNPIMQRELWLKDKYKAEIAYPMQESEIGKEGYATAEQKAEVDKAVGRVGEVDYDNADAYFFAKFVGTENDEELTTWCGALNYAFPLLMSEYPTSKIMIIVPDHEKHGKLIREATIKMAEKWGVLYFDLNSLPYWYGSEKTKFENTQHEEMSWLLASGETTAPTVEGFNKSRYSYDGVRPSELGHKVISFPIGNKLING